MKNLFVAAVFLTAAPVFADDDADAKKAAETYLNALTGKGDEAGKDLLLGGVTMNAQLFSLENWRFKDKDPVRKEDGDLAHATTRPRTRTSTTVRCCRTSSMPAARHATPA